MKASHNFKMSSKNQSKRMVRSKPKKKTVVASRRAPARKAAVRRPRKRANRGTGNGTVFRNRNVTRQTMRITNNGQRGLTKVCPPFCEQIGQPLSSQAWALFKSYSINPGQVATFPLGAQECINWQKYRFKWFKVVYEPIVNEYNTNNDGAGEVIIGFDPDASDQAPSTFSQAVNSKPVARGRPCDKIVLDVPVMLLHNNLDAHFIRHGNLPGGSDIKTYDVGLVNVSVVGSGTTGATTLGNLFFDYQLEILVQQAQLNTLAPANNQVSVFYSAGGEAITTATPYQPLIATVGVSNGLNAVNTAGSVVLPPGNYIIDATFNLVAGTLITGISAEYMKNGAAYEASDQILTIGAGAALVQTSLSLPSLFYTSNGTDTLNLRIVGTFTGGNGFVTASLRVVAV